MIEFRQKEFSEYDAMRSFYNAISRDNRFRNKVKIIDSSALLPVLRGNNVIIERFVISTQRGKKDRFRMYIKVGARAKMPEGVRLPGRDRTNKLFRSSLKFNGGTFLQQKDNSEVERQFSHSNNNKNKNNNNNNNGGGGGDINSNIDFGSFEINYDTTKPLGDTVLYDPKSRSLVLEFDDIQNAVDALDMLPFGINYNIYLLDL